MTSLLTRFRSGIGWNFVSVLSLQGGTFFTNLWIANLIGTTSYGQFGLVVSSAQTIGALLQLSTGIAANKYISQFRRTDPSYAAAVLIFCSRISNTAGVIGTVLMLAVTASGLLAERGFSTLSYELIIASPIVYCSILMGFQMGALAGVEGFANAAKALLPLMVLQVVSTGLATLWFGLEGALFAMAGNMILRTFVTGQILRREVLTNQLTCPRSIGPDLKKIFLNFMLPGALTGLTTMPSLWYVSSELAQTNDGYTQLGLFNAAYAIRGILMILPWIVNAVGFSLLNAHLAEGEEKNHRTVLLMNLFTSFVAVSVGAVVVLLAADRILGAYGQGFVIAAPILSVLMFSLVFEALALPLYQALASHGRMWSTFIFVLFPRDLTIALVGAWSVHQYGAIGLAWVNAGAWGFAMFALASMNFLVNRK